MFMRLGQELLWYRNGSVVQGKKMPAVSCWFGMCVVLFALLRLC